jgi:SlyX protein
MSMEAKLTELQIKLSFQEEMLDTLNRQIADQELRLAKLNLQVQALIERVRSLDANPQQAGSAEYANHEVPPHY